MNQDELHSLIARDQPNICQIVVLRDGREICSDEWNGYARNDCTHIMSATKSVVSLLTGIAIDKGWIGSVNDRVLDYFPDYEVKRGEKTIADVTIKHLLTMRAPYKGKGDPWTEVCSSEDWTKASLDRLGGRKGITGEFDYRTVCLHILSGLLYRASGMKTVDMANRYLFCPLGIAEHVNYTARTAQEHKAFTIEKTPKRSVWFADPLGLGTPGYGLCMSAADMARLGQMCLDGGVHDGKVIVSREWISEMTRPREVEKENFRGMSYGYLWWIVHPGRSVYAAIGNSGNVIYVDPENRTVVAVSAYFKPTVFDRVDFIEQVLLPEILGRKN